MGARRKRAALRVIALRQTIFSDGAATSLPPLWSCHLRCVLGAQDGASAVRAPQARASVPIVLVSFKLSQAHLEPVAHVNEL